VSSSTVGFGGVHEGLCITVQVQDEAVLYGSTMAKVYHFSELLVGRAAFAPLSGQGSRCFDHECFDHHGFNRVVLLTPEGVDGAGSAHANGVPLLTPPLGTAAAEAAAAGGGGKLPSLPGHQYSSFGMRLQGPRRYWRRWMEE
jgi:hypothetical protein